MLSGTASEHGTHSGLFLSIIPVSLGFKANLTEDSMFDITLSSKRDYFLLHATSEAELARNSFQRNSETSIVRLADRCTQAVSIALFRM